jgi:hypothetical protein
MMSSSSNSSVIECKRKRKKRRTRKKSSSSHGICNRVLLLLLICYQNFFSSHEQNCNIGFSANFHFLASYKKMGFLELLCIFLERERERALSLRITLSFCRKLGFFC